jgi:phage gp29-like protein
MANILTRAWNAVTGLADAKGQPVRTGDLRQEVATPQLTRMRTPYAAYIGEITPEWLAMTLRLCEHGQNPERYLALAEVMEERDLHYRSVLGTRKMALTGREIIVEPFSTSRQDRKIADFVREVLSADEFADVVGDQQDALGKGFSVGEIIWDVSGSEWRPARIAHKDPRWFGFPLESPYWPCLRDGGALVPLTPYKFIVHVPKLKSGLPLRGGLARAAAWSFMAKNFTQKDWLAFSEVYGMPLRLGKYPIGAEQDHIDILTDAVSAIGSDFAGVFPENMSIELKESGSKGASADIYQRLCEYLDKQVSKATLGQTETADATPGRLGAAKEKNEVRHDILRFDARQNLVTNKRDLILPLVRLNYGPSAALPLIHYDLPDTDDKELLIKAVQAFVPMGMQVDEDWARAKFGIPKPAEDADLLKAPGAISPLPQGEGGVGASQNSHGHLSPSPQPSPARRGSDCPHCRTAHGAAPLTASAEGAEPTPHDEIVGAYADQLGEQSADALKAMLDTIRQAAELAEDLPALRDHLLAMYGELPADQLREVMSAGFALAHLAGRYQVKEESGE